MNNTLSKKTTNCAILVSSCDAFEDVWDPFFKLFFRYWPDCPFPIYLINEVKRYNNERVTNALLGDDLKWATNLRRTLTEIASSHILYLQEDYFLQKPVETKNILQLLDFAKAYQVAYLRLVPAPGDQKIKGSSVVRNIAKTAAYRTSLQAAIWDKKILLSLIKEGESGWDMEMAGSVRSQEMATPFLAVKKSVLPYFDKTAIKKGKWYYDAVKFCERAGIAIDLSKRPVESREAYVWRRLTSVSYFGKTIRRVVRRVLNFNKRRSS